MSPPPAPAPRPPLLPEHELHQPTEGRACSISPTHLRRGTCFPADESGASARSGAKSAASAHGMLCAQRLPAHAPRAATCKGTSQGSCPQTSCHLPAGFAHSSPHRVHNAPTPALKRPWMGKKPEHHPAPSSIPPSSSSSASHRAVGTKRKDGSSETRTRGHGYREGTSERQAEATFSKSASPFAGHSAGNVSSCRQPTNYSRRGSIFASILPPINEGRKTLGVFCMPKAAISS